MIDPYRVLQVDPADSVEVISAAYRRLARRHHPDLSHEPDAEHRMAELNAAWAILRHPERRAAYDRERLKGQRRPEPTGMGRTYDPWERTDGMQARAGSPAGTRLTFGRYEGWTLAEVARVDIDYLIWFARVPGGRNYRHEIVALLKTMGRDLDGSTDGSGPAGSPRSAANRGRDPLHLEGLGWRFRRKR